MAEVIDAGEDLLGAEDKGKERADDAAGGRGIADGLAIGHGLPKRREHVGGRQGPAPGFRKGFRQPQHAPGERQQAVEHQHDEDAAPRRHQQHRLSERGSDHGHRDEHHHGKRHHARHAAADIAVAHDRGRDHACCRGAEPLERARQQQRLERGRRDRQHARHRIDRHAAEQHWPAAEAVRQGTHHELAGAETDQEGRQHQLQMVGDGNVEGCPDIGQRGQHHVHRKRIQRHDGRDHDDEFWKSHRAVSCGHPIVGIDVRQEAHL